MSHALTASTISKSFGGNHVLKDVTIHVGDGEVVALVGPNGAGKTSLLNILSGQLRPDAGRITVDDIDVTTRPPSHRTRRRVLRSFQDGGTFGELTVLENIMVALVVRGYTHESARVLSEAATARVGLKAVQDVTAKRLSGGQRKLVDFARVSVCDARVQLFDEPTAGVLPHLCNLMSDIILERRDAGVATLVVSHDLPWTMTVCSRVIVLARGRVLADGSPDEIQNSAVVQEAYLV